MSKRLQRIIQFMKVDIWRLTPADVPPPYYVAVSALKKLLLAVRFFTTKGVFESAAALTYSTLLAIVPISAVVFAIARGFGFSKYIEDWFRSALSSQPQAADTIIRFVNSYLVHTHSGVILGIGLVFMLWTVLMLTRNIEQTFNNIWQVERERSLVRTVTDYLAMFFMLPIIIILISGVSVFLTAVVKQTHEYLLLGPMMRLSIDIMPYVIMSAVFIALYVFMPNTKVKIGYTIIPGILAGVAMQLLQLFYVHCQLFLSSYNAVYGSFAALPLFMLWVQISWTICLFGAELSYTNQNLETFAFLAKTDDISHRYRLMMSALLLNKICKRFAEGRKPYSALELKLETGIPIRVTTDLLHDMVKIHLLSESIGGKRSDDEVLYQPAEDLERITVGVLVDRLEATGSWRLDLDLHLHLDSVAWRQVMQSREQYFGQLRMIKVQDL
ncbi:MAG: YihY/virulence factor BrkB family protein [Hoylesella enoeca]|uniref:YihY/virulence factor BrkB family protein n=1 Tax=Hoylesella enoeca TaxID=76123 RepID=UPI0028EBFD10|nr:YihY/virulence factor BrkB family protein [Hoylesella enoeca]